MCLSKTIYLNVWEGLQGNTFVKGSPQLDDCFLNLILLYTDNSEFFIVLLIWILGITLMTVNGCLQTGLNPFEYWMEIIKNIIHKLKEVGKYE